MDAAAYSDSSLSGSDVDSDDDVRSVISQVAFDGRHPFVLKERKEIVIRVRDFNPLPIRSSKEVLREQFPVSSGQKHHIGELEWREVSPPPPDGGTLAVMPPPTTPAPKAKKKTAEPLPPPSFVPPPKPPVPIGPQQPEPSTETSAKDDSLAPTQPTPDIGSIMATRLSAMRVLEKDPLNLVAIKQLQQAQEMVKQRCCG